MTNDELKAGSQIPQIDQERLAKWRENTLLVELPEGFKRPMKLEWRMSSDGDRWFANVAEGQLIITKTAMGLWIPEPMLFGFKVNLADQNGMKHVLKIAHDSDEIAKHVVEHWYNSARKEQGDD